MKTLFQSMLLSIFTRKFIYEIFCKIIGVEFAAKITGLIQIAEKEFENFREKKGEQKKQWVADKLKIWLEEYLKKFDIPPILFQIFNISVIIDFVIQFTFTYLHKMKIINIVRSGQTK